MENWAPEKNSLSAFPLTEGLNGNPEFDENGNFLEVTVSENGNAPLYKLKNKDGKIVPSMFDPAGKEFGSFKEEKAKNSSITPEKYLSSFIYPTLNEDWKISLYAELFLPYAYDSSDSWRTPAEMVEKGGGDCEDLAFFAQDVLSQQGRKAEVVYIANEGSDNGHAILVELVKKGEKYFAKTWDTMGYENNGKFYGDPDTASKDGYNTPEEAFNAVMVKYKNKVAKDNEETKEGEKKKSADYGIDKPIDFKAESGDTEVIVLNIKDKNKTAEQGKYDNKKKIKDLSKEQTTRVAIKDE